MTIFFKISDFSKKNVTWKLGFFQFFGRSDFLVKNDYFSKFYFEKKNNFKKLKKSEKIFFRKTLVFQKFQNQKKSDEILFFSIF